MSKVRVFRLVSGEEIVAEVQKEGDAQYLVKPIQLVGNNLMPFMFSVKGHKLPYPKHEQVIFVGDARKELVAAYREFMDPNAVKPAESPPLVIPGANGREQ